LLATSHVVATPRHFVAVLATDCCKHKHSSCNQQGAKAIWRKPHRICRGDLDPHLIQFSSSPQYYSSQAGPGSLQPVRGTSDLSACKISAKSDNPRPSYSDVTNSTWPPSAILDFQGKRIWTIPHVDGPRSLRTHRIRFKKISRSVADICRSNELRNDAPGGYFRFQR